MYSVHKIDFVKIKYFYFLLSFIFDECAGKIFILTFFRYTFHQKKH